MGAMCVRGLGEKSTIDSIKHKTPVVSESNKTRSPDILDDDFKTQINGVIDECVVSIPASYKTERDRIVNEMSRSAPEPYLGLLFSEYPDVNGLTVNEMARRLVLSNDSKKQISDQVNVRMEPSFALRTTDWDATAQETARSAVQGFIQQHVSDAVDTVKLE